MDNKLIYKFPVKKSLLIVLRHMWFYAFTEAHPFSVTTYTHTPRHDSPHSLPHPSNSLGLHTPAVCSLYLRHWQCSKGDFLWLLCSFQLLGKNKILSTTLTILIWRTWHNFRRRNIRWVRGGPAEQMSRVCLPPDGTLKAPQIQGYNLSLFFKAKLQVNSYSFWFCFKSLLLV